MSWPYVIEFMDISWFNTNSTVEDTLDVSSLVDSVAVNTCMHRFVRVYSEVWNTTALD